MRLVERNFAEPRSVLRGRRRLGAERLPLGLRQVTDRHLLRRRDLRRVAQVPLGVERGLAAGGGGGDGLAVGVIDEVSGRVRANRITGTLRVDYALDSGVRCTTELVGYSLR